MSDGARPDADEEQVRAALAAARVAGADALPQLEAIDRQFGESTDPRVLAVVIEARVDRAELLGQRGRVPEAVELLGEVVRQHAEVAEEPARTVTTSAISLLGTLAARSGDFDAAIVHFDNAIARHPPSVAAGDLVRLSQLLCNKVTACMQCERHEEALAACEQALEQIGDREEEGLVRMACRIRTRQAVTLGMLDRTDEANAVADDIIRQADVLVPSGDPELVFACAQALFNRGIQRLDRDDAEEALRDFEQAVRTAGDRSEPNFEHLALHAVACQAEVHTRLGNLEAALAASEQIEARFGEREDIAFAEPVARALLGSAHLLHDMGREEEATAAIEAVQQRYGERQEPPLVELVRVARQVWKRPVWRDHPHLAGKFHDDSPDDLQVIVHDGGPRLTQTRPEAVWVRVTDADGDLFRGIVLNKPQQLESVQLGGEVRFLVAQAAPHPLMVTEKYLQERDAWEILPCDKCGLAELFDAPSDLYAATFPDTPAEHQILDFTAFCPLCGGGQVVSAPGRESATGESPPAARRESTRPQGASTPIAETAPKRRKPWWRFGF